MKKMLTILLVPIYIFAKVHYAKVEPYENITLKSAVSAQVIFAKKKLEGTHIIGGILVKLDSKLDYIKLKTSQRSLELINRMIMTNQEVMISIQEALNRHEEYYTRISMMNSASKTQKNNAFYSYNNSKTQYLSTQEKIDSLEKQKLDIKFEIKRLKDSISKKNIRVKNKFINKLLVAKGDFVNMGTPIAQLNDLSSGKLVLFLESEELKNIKKKKIYINDKVTTYKISKIWLITDKKFISSYRTEIIIKNPKSFSKVLKVEFK